MCDLKQGIVARPFCMLWTLRWKLSPSEMQNSASLKEPMEDCHDQRVRVQKVLTELRGKGWGKGSLKGKHNHLY